MNERYRNGALNIETIEVSPVVSDGKISGLVKQEKNHATELIEDFMIAANGVVARMLEASRVSSIRRVVKVPERWDRIVELAAKQGGQLPAKPDSKALNEFLIERKAADPDHFTDLSLAVIKLMGPGEYVLERPGDPEQGHFGLAVQDYTHSTAPNRRFADLVTQRVVKAVLAKQPSPYSDDQLAAIASNCTLKEDAARKVEREMSKRIGAVAMSSRIGETFDAIVTGVIPRGTPSQAIVAATQRPAELLGIQDMGTLAVGKSADFIVLNANPLDDIHNTRQIASVYLRGKMLNRDALLAGWKRAGI
jgi:exoribonuclease-2